MASFGSKLSMPDAVQLVLNDSCGFKSSVLFATTPNAWNELQTTDFIDDKPVINQGNWWKSRYYSCWWCV